MRASVDIATAIYNKLVAGGYSASAHAIPATLGTTLPHVHVERTGGYTNDMVIETNQVDFDVYDKDPADAMASASDLCAWVRDLAGEILETQCYAVEITTLPYQNPDPRNFDVARVTFKAQILLRVKERSLSNA